VANGSVKKIWPDKGFGFITVGNVDARDGQQADAFFHMNDLVDLEFGEQLIERPVTFDLEDQPKGPRARNVRAAR